ncbi:predicted protein [Botrytis cinerea T4]|uniref:Uncharacterized protein n=1 Tax=Botryotinia fuckeliana (strain T4) TaxID=999810 RepID=G2YW35_BOTF4|nr:predicted protein [Botrytis cinerea T4]
MSAHFTLDGNEKSRESTVCTVHRIAPQSYLTPLMKPIIFRILFLDHPKVCTGGWGCISTDATADCRL